ncbi:hypothetical protein QBC46DRAFT_398578 [Diplogelasinospora grovesii]|uniref:Uncharacterized protein n=1 Tax=Diplogelasinospora grovesii TaxID=303347 RepID=A0AAN6MXL3_9PEZI|nr:hypothetical protein QBC46DRAFT_398578 [Diplogelasinospora grovesii]
MRAGGRTVALTNYHVVRPAVEGFRVGVVDHEVKLGESVKRGTMGSPVKDSALWKADIKGLFPKDAEKHKNMEHPARSKHNFTVEIMREPIRQVSPTRRPDHQKRLDEQIAFFDGDKQYLGRVWFASGYTQRTGTNGRLDWALVVPTDEGEKRIGGNILPREENWEAKYYYNYPKPWTYGGNLKQQARSIHDAKNGDRMFKIGASTTSTMGTFSDIKPDCIISEERYMVGRREAELRSSEYMFVDVVGIARKEIFGNRGDSGSIVWDDEGRAMGLLFTGQTPHQTEERYCLVTPIEDVFKSIKEMSGGNIEDIRIAGG